MLVAFGEPKAEYITDVLSLEGQLVVSAVK